MVDTANRGGDPPFDRPALTRHLTPELVVALHEGYSLSRLRQDAIAGLTVAILALPLSMAIAIGAGLAPEKGLITSIIAGFLISALGGSRHQIGGPAAAFIVVIAAIIDQHGQAGLMTATFLAGLMLIAAAVMQLGSYVRYVPVSVILGFTSGVGVLIALGQIKDFMGLHGDIPAAPLSRIIALWEIRATFSISSFAVGLATLGLIIGCRRFAPKIPGLLVAVVGVSAAVAILQLPVATIGSRFGGIAAALPMPQLPDLSWQVVAAVFPSALTLAFLIGVESLLSAVAADAITGRRHQSNAEVLAQGVANIASPLFGGLPATGVLARTGTNISAGGQTPVSGLLHAVFVLVAMVALAPLAGALALPCLAAVLLSVAWRLIDIEGLISFVRRTPRDDVLVMLTTLMLTIIISLDVAIAVGVVVAALLFVHRLGEAQNAVQLADGAPVAATLLPRGVHFIRYRGALYYGVADRISHTPAHGMSWPRAIVLDLSAVPLIDATAMAAVGDLARECARRSCHLLICGLAGQPQRAVLAYGQIDNAPIVYATDRDAALEKVWELTAGDAAGQRA